MDTLEILGLVRARNAARWLPALLRGMRSICGEVILLDACSTDMTNAAAQLQHVEVLSEMGSLDEGRDWRRLYDAAHELSPRFCLIMDGCDMLQDNQWAEIKVYADMGKAEGYAFETLAPYTAERGYGNLVNIRTTDIRLFRHHKGVYPHRHAVLPMLGPVEVFERGNWMTSPIIIQNMAYSTHKDRTKRLEDLSTLPDSPIIRFIVESVASIDG